MAIDLPTLIQRVQVDTSGMAKAEAEARSFGAAMKAASGDADISAKKLSADTEKLTSETEKSAKATEHSNTAHRATPGAVGPATSALSGHGKATKDAATETENLGTKSRKAALDVDLLGNSVSRSSTHMKKARTDSEVLKKTWQDLTKLMGPAKLLGIASFISPAATAISSLGAGAIAVVGGLGQMTTALAAAGVAAAGSLSQISGVGAALPGIAGALLTGKAAITATFKGSTGSGPGYDAAVKTAAAANAKLAAAQGKLTTAQAKQNTTASGTASGAAKVTAATLRAAAATSRYQAVLNNPKATQAQLLSAQASVVSTKAALAAAKSPAAAKAAPSTAGVVAAQAAADKANAAVAKFGSGVADISKEVDVYKANLTDMGNITRSITVPGFIEGMKAAEPVFDVLKGGARSLAHEIAPLAVELGKFVGSKGFLSDLSSLADNNARVFGALGGALRPIVGTLTNIGVAAEPMTLALANAGKQFATFLEGKTGDRDKLTNFFNRAGVQAIALAESIGNVMGTLVAVGGIGAQVFFGTKGLAGGMADSTDKMLAWTKSGEGIDRITGFFQRMKPVAVDTWSALKDFTKGLYDLFRIGNDTFFGSGGLAGGIADTAKKFSDWTDSPGGVKAITGYFAEMKPIAKESLDLVTTLVKDLFSLAHNADTAGLLKVIRVDLLPVITQMLTKISDMAPVVGDVLKGIGNFAASLDPTVILAVAGGFGEMVGQLGTLIGMVPGLGTIVSGLVLYLGARKLLSGALVPLIGLAKGDSLAKVFGSASTAGGKIEASTVAAAGTLREGGAAAGGAIEASATAALATLTRAGAVLATETEGGATAAGATLTRAGATVATEEAGGGATQLLLPGMLGAGAKAGVGAAEQVALPGLETAGAAVAGTTVAKTGVWALITSAWGGVAGMVGTVVAAVMPFALGAAAGWWVGNIVADKVIKPTQTKLAAGAQSAGDATDVWNKSKKTDADAATYTAALAKAATDIKTTSDSTMGQFDQAGNTFVTGLLNILGVTHDKKTIADVQGELLAGIRAQIDEVNLETKANHILWLKTAAGKAWQAEEDKKTAAANTAAQTPAAVAATDQKRHEQDITDAKAAVAKWEKDQAAKHTKVSAAGKYGSTTTTTPWDAETPEMANARRILKEEAERVTAAAKAATLAADAKLIKNLAIVADASREAADKKTEGPGGRQYDPRLVAIAAADQKKLDAALLKQNTDSGGVYGPPVASPAPGTPGNPQGKPQPGKPANPQAATPSIVYPAANTPQAGPGITLPDPKPVGAAYGNGIAQGIKNSLLLTSIDPGTNSVKTKVTTGLSGLSEIGRAAGVAGGQGVTNGLGTFKFPVPPVNTLAWFEAGYGSGDAYLKGLIKAGLTPQAAKNEAQNRAFDQGTIDAGADGGLLTGSRGGPREDNLLFRGSRGEFISNAAATKQHLPLLKAWNAGQFKDGGMLGSASGVQPVSPYMPRLVVAGVAAPAPGPRPVEFHIGKVEDGDTLLRQARATDRMMALAEGGDSTQMMGLGI